MWTGDWKIAPVKLPPERLPPPPPPIFVPGLGLGVGLGLGLGTIFRRSFFLVLFGPVNKKVRDLTDTRKISHSWFSGERKLNKKAFE